YSHPDKEQRTPRAPDNRNQARRESGAERVMSGTPQQANPRAARRGLGRKRFHYKLGPGDTPQHPPSSSRPEPAGDDRASLGHHVGDDLTLGRSSFHPL